MYKVPRQVGKVSLMYFMSRREAEQEAGKHGRRLLHLPDNEWVTSKASS